ncbi:MAG: diaminopimelate epimerase [Duncaniella sp.]|nr:diaminopimelate epimerase [Duncaniella sp.]
MTSNRPSASDDLVRFTKMHGAGNDYIYIDCLKSMPDKPDKLAEEISSRHFGVGSDGLVLICPSDVADLRMRMFNADGSEGKMCGNAARCIALYAVSHGLVDSDTINLETLSGLKVLIVNRDSQGYFESVTVDMGAPVFDSDSIPVLSQGSTMIEEEIPTSRGIIKATAVSMGNPHCVIFVDSLDEIDFDILGPELECNPLFPDRTNVEFVEILSPDTVRVRVWERGSGETLACGTGACAVAAASLLTSRTGREITVRLRGGDLRIKIDQETGHVLMTGPAEEVFEGVYRRKEK